MIQRSEPPPGFVSHRRWIADIATITPEEAAERNERFVREAVREAGIEFFHVPQLDRGGRTVGIDRGDVHDLIAALDAVVGTEPVHLLVYGEGGEKLAAGLVADLPREVLDRATVIRVCRVSLWPGRTLLLGPDVGCDVELWTVDASGARRAPRSNSMTGRTIHRAGAEVVPAPGVVVEGPTLEAFRSAPADRVTFPIDAVYLWVDGDDPKWQAKRDAARSAADAADVRLHAEADVVERYRCRDELKYSLRSLEAFAPWVRRVFIVTDQQRPPWLNESAADVTVIDHRDIFPTDWLPVFNSHAISSRLHHIPGLSEHYLLMNDDVFFGRWCRPETFFTPAGQPRFFASSVRIPPGPPASDDLPHEGAQRRTASLLESDLGRRPMRAFFHVPHPQSRSLHDELEARYPDVYETTGRSTFRDVGDYAVASVLHHAFGEITGRCVAGDIRYAYVNPSLPSHRQILTRLLRLRDRDAFCLNDVVTEESDGRGGETLERFVRTFLPVPSSYELEDSAHDSQPLREGPAVGA